jgi:hypothetical protein
MRKIPPDDLGECHQQGQADQCRRTQERPGGRTERAATAADPRSLAGLPLALPDPVTRPLAAGLLVAAELTGETGLAAEMAIESLSADYRRG